MNEFLNKEILNNTIGQYLIVAAIISFAFLAKKYIAHYAAGLIFSVLKTRWKNIDKNSFKNLVAKPLGLFFAVFITIVTLDKLKYPDALDFYIYHIHFKELLRMIGTGLLIITFFMFIIKCIDFIALVIKARYIQDDDKANHQFIFFIKDFIKVIIGIIAVLMVLKYSFGYDVKGLLTGLSIVGAAVALALKESLENLIASFIIFLNKPFTTGDLVKVNNVSGVVEKVGLRSTRIRSEAKTYITVPNKQMVDSILDNLSNRTQRRGDLRLELSPATEQQMDIFITGLRKILGRENIENFNVQFGDITSTAYVVTSDFYTAPVNISEFNKIKEEINLEILALMEQAGVKITGRSTDINIIADPAAQPAKPTSIL